jgi:hypothetical protein
MRDRKNSGKAIVAFVAFHLTERIHSMNVKWMFVPAILAAISLVATAAEPAKNADPAKNTDTANNAKKDAWTQKQFLIPSGASRRQPIRPWPQWLRKTTT